MAADGLVGLLTPVLKGFQTDKGFFMPVCMKYMPAACICFEAAFRGSVKPVIVSASWPTTSENVTGLARVAGVMILRMISLTTVRWR